MQPKEKFIAFIDILGFSDLVEKAEKTGEGFARALELTEALGSEADGQKFADHGPTTCPSSARIQKDLDFKVTQISDCAVLSVEVSPAGIVNLLNHCFVTSLKLLAKGALCRGLILRGNIHHDGRQFIGTGYMTAFRGESQVRFLQKDESEKGTPFIALDSEVVQYIQNETDDCVLKMTDRMTRSDGKYTAIYPFKAMGTKPSSIVTADFDPTYWKEQLNRSIGFRQADLDMFAEQLEKFSDEKAKSKVAHYAKGLEEVIEELRKRGAQLDRMIQTGRIPYGTVW